MKQKRDPKQFTAIIYGFAAVVLFAALFWGTFRDRRQVQEETRAQVMLLGDSIPGECRNETSVTSVLSSLLGENVFNGALGGTSMGRLDSSLSLSNTKDCLSMQALSQAIATKDFGSQQTVYSREAATDYFTVAIDMMETVDFDGLQVLLIEHGINDYHAGIPLDNPDDPYDPYTFSGALRSTIRTLREAYPKLRVILITPTYSWYPNHQEPYLTCETYDLGGGVLADYVEAEKKVAEELEVELIDHYSLYPHEAWNDWERYTRDGIHPNEEGRKLIAQSIYEYLQEAPP